MQQCLLSFFYISLADSQASHDSLESHGSPDSRPLAISDRPTLPLLHNLPTPSGGFINIIQRITQVNHTLGIRLHRYGDITANIEAQYRGDQCRITEEIFHKWLNGTGRTPRSWATLVAVLREMRMEALALEIERNIAQ